MSPLRTAMLLLLLCFPLLEIVVLIEVGRAIGFWPTLALLFLSAAAGMLIIRDHGLSMVARMFDSIGRGGLAFVSMVDSYVIVVAGGLLIIPGFITDAIAIALLVAPLRQIILGAVLPGFTDARRADKAGRAEAKPAAAPRRPIVIEGTFERIDEEDPRR